MPRPKSIEHPSMLARVEKKLDRVLQRQALILRKLRGRGGKKVRKKTDYRALGLEVAAYCVMRRKRDGGNWPLLADVLESFAENRNVGRPSFYRAINAVKLQRVRDHEDAKSGKKFRRLRLVVPVHVQEELNGQTEE